MTVGRSGLLKQFDGRKCDDWALSRKIAKHEAERVTPVRSPMACALTESKKFVTLKFIKKQATRCCSPGLREDLYGLRSTKDALYLCLKRDEGRRMRRRYQRQA